MSLDVFNKDTLFSRMSTNDYFIKVIYNRLKPDFDYNENIQILENLHNNIIDNINLPILNFGEKLYKPFHMTDKIHIYTEL